MAHPLSSRHAVVHPAAHCPPLGATDASAVDVAATEGAMHGGYWPSPRSHAALMRTRPCSPPVRAPPRSARVAEPSSLARGRRVGRRGGGCSAPPEATLTRDVAKAPILGCARAGRCGIKLRRGAAPFIVASHTPPVGRGPEHACCVESPSCEARPGMVCSHAGPCQGVRPRRGYMSVECCRAHAARIPPTRRPRRRLRRRQRARCPRRSP